MVVIVVVFEVLPECIESFKQAAIRQAVLSKENESACLQFDVSQDSVDPSRFYLYERYTDADAFASHQQTQYFATFRSTIAPMLRSRQRYEATRVEPIE